MPEVLASDGLRARENGDYAETKLAFLDEYGPPALDATARKHRRVYLDLFAGPGINVVRRGGQEFEGGALRAIRMHGARHPDIAFTDVALINLNRLDHAALQTRVDRLCARGECRVSRDRILVERADANECLPGVLGRYHALDYLLVFADLEAPRQWPWSSVEALKAQGHRSVDLYMLFPLEMGISRLLAYNEADRDRYGHILTRFFGNERWRTIAGRRTTDAQAPTFRREVEELYLAQLRERWAYAGKIADVRLRGRQGLYRMLFAADHDAAKKIAAWAKKRTSGDSGQMTLL